MTIAPPEPQASGTRVALGGDVRFVDPTDTGVREVEARVLSYGAGPDTYGTTWGRGVFDSSIRDALASGTPIPFVFGHDERSIANVIGSVAGWEDRPDGLYLRMRMADFDEVPSARSAYSLIRDRHVAGFSVKFRDGKTMPDPNHRNALQFTSAKLVHIAAVIDPSVPGTKTTAVRAAEEDGDPARAADSLNAAIQAGVREVLADMFAGQRSITITVGDDGTITTSGDADTDAGDDGADDDDDVTPESLAQAVDAALDQFQAIADAIDVTSLPADVQQAFALATAAGVAADELLEAMGVPDADDLDDDTAAEARAAAAELAGERAAVSDEPWNFDEADYSLEQLRRACLIVLDDGKTKDDCKLAVRLPDGTLSRNGCHAAAAVLGGGRGGVDAPMAAKVAAAKTLAGLYRSQLKEDPPKSLLKLAGEDTGARSADLDARVALATTVARWR